MTTIIERLKKAKKTAQEPESLEKGKQVTVETDANACVMELTTGLRLLKEGKHEEIWQRYCGWIDLSLEEFMAIQHRLLKEQIGLLNRCELGKVLMRGTKPRSVDEFRAQVPLTTYKDYAPYFQQKQRMDILPRKPLLWQHTSGKSGEYDFKWVPTTARYWQEIEGLIFTLLCFATCQKRGEVNFKLGDKMLYGAAPPPYVTGNVMRYGIDKVVNFLPPLDEAEILPFAERFQKGFKLALSEGLDLFISMPSVMVAAAEGFSQGGRKRNIKALLRQPKMLLRIMRGVIRSKLAHRPMLPRDVWSVKGLITGGSDSSVYREKIKAMWGRYPLDLYASTEAMTIAFQTWDYQDLVFYPALNFYEFIPEAESLRSKLDPDYQPSTLLLSEVKPGENFELVITNFHGGPFTRYRQGDMIKITAMRNERLNIDIPQMVYHSRVDDLIDIAGFTRLTETIIWKALENTGIAYEDWTTRKELDEKPILHIYVEPRVGNHFTTDEMAAMIHEQLKILDTPYSELESYLGLKPIEVTLLPQGAFSRYMLKQQAAGVELGRVKASHINPTDDVLDFLINSRPQVKVTSTEERQTETVSGRQI